MNQLKGTIYIRDNAWYKMENVIKMGIATFAKDRSNTYITGEVERGEYICVIEITLDKMKFIDNSFIFVTFETSHVPIGGKSLLKFISRYLCTKLCIVLLFAPTFIYSFNCIIYFIF